MDFFICPILINLYGKNLRDEADNKIRPLPKGIISGSDKSQITINVAKENLSRLPYSESVTLSAHPFQHIKQFENGVTDNESALRNQAW